MLVQNTHHGEDHHHGILSKIVKDLFVAYDWLSGPPMTDHDRTNREIAEARPYTNRDMLV